MGRKHDFPAISIRIEPNFNGSEILWKVHIEAPYVREAPNVKRLLSTFGTNSNGFAASPTDAMQKAMAFIEATMRANGTQFTGPTLAVDNTTNRKNSSEND